MAFDERLQALGWDHFFQQQLIDTGNDLTPARVCRQDINQYHLLTAKGKLTGQLPGKLRQQALSKAGLPAVGDWVLVRQIQGGEKGQVVIEQLLERKSRFARKEAGPAVDEQILAANIDLIFIVSGLDDDFNPNRIERYLLLARDSGARPVILLNKTDLCSDLDKKISQLVNITRGDIPVLAISAKDNIGIDAIRAYIRPGTSCVLLGSSGVGKSALINSLVGYERFKTRATREQDGRGRHTTTFRGMVELDDGGLVIDTPGIREIQVWVDEDSLNQSFTDIDELSRQCKFSDCAHDSEPGCAVTTAISQGDLEAERLERYRKLKQEMRLLGTREDVSTRAEKKLARKRFARLVKHRPDAG